MSLAQILANVEQLQKEQADIYDSNQRFSEERLPIEVPSGGGIFTNRFENFAPRFGGIADININPQLTEQELIARFLETEGADVETNPFVQQNIFQRGLNFLQENPAARVGLGAILGGPVGAIAGFFANKIGGGIMNAINNFRNRGRDVEIGLPQVIQTGSDFVDEFSRNDPGTVGGSSFDTATGGTFGSSVDDASTFSDYS